MFRVLGLTIFFLFVLTSCRKSFDSLEVSPLQSNDIAAVNAQRLMTENQDGTNWMSHGRTYSEQRYSPSTEINVKNISDLGLAWSFDLETKR